MAFNRPGHLSALIDRLREVRPTRLFVAVDGARPERAGEAEQVRACRDLVQAVDWPCELSTLFQDSNLGCGLGVSTAITWFFEQVERGIILEDDILPEPSFFDFCAELLERYEDDERVFAISGCNYVPSGWQGHPEQPYRFSRVPHVWGWATWRRSWMQHRLDIAGWRGRLPLRTLWSRSGHSVPGTVYWTSTFELLARKQVDTWDGQLVLAAMAADQWTATSNVNLIRNVGFGTTATHTIEDRDELQPIGRLEHPLAAVPVAVDEKSDAWTRRHHFRATWPGMWKQGERYLRQRRGRTS